MPTTRSHTHTHARTGGSHLTLAVAIVLPWLAWSAVRAEPLLPADCPPSNHGCLELGDPGCSDVACCKIVCGFDAFCCAVSWDEPCVDAAGVLCEVADPCAASDHGCLTVGGPGCTDVACCESVCAIDPLCCGVAWTQDCVEQASVLCRSPSGGDCCVARSSPGCADSKCETAVCEIAPSCCEAAWDDNCALIAGDACTLLCGTQCDEGSACCEAVCTLDPVCCDKGWDQLCAESAAFVCTQDCNLNSVLDILDLQMGSSLDCNGDYVPDECSGSPRSTCAAALVSAPCCVDFDDGTQQGFMPCPTAPKITLSVQQPGPSGLPGDRYLRLQDGSGASAACGPLCPGDWTAIAQSSCGKLCFDVLIIEDGLTGGSIPITPSIQLHSGAIRAVFVASSTVTEGGGANPGWHTVCAPIALLDSSGNLPSDAGGTWQMVGAAPNSAWNTLLANVTSVQLPIDFTSNPAELAGYDNLCLLGCPFAITDVEVQCECPGAYSWTFAIENTTSQTAHFVSFSLPSVAPNPVPLNPPLGLAPGASLTSVATFCGLSECPTFSAFLLNASGVPIASAPAEFCLPSLDCKKCEVDCEQANLFEDEECGSNTANPGCDAPEGVVPAFGSLRCGDTVCGGLWASDGQQDTDWYFVDLTDENGDGMDRLCLSLASVIPATVQVLSGSCNSTLGPIEIARLSSNNCESKTMCICLPAPGKYKLRVFPDCPPCGPITSALPCSDINQYLLAVECDLPCACVQPPSNMKAWWPLDETAGGVASESVCACGTTGTWVNGPTPIPGVVDGALMFDGIDDNVSVAGNAYLKAGPLDLTVDAWIRWMPSSPLSFTSEGIVGGEGYAFYVIPTSTVGALLAFTHNSGGGVGCVSLPDAVPAGQWTHVAATLQQGQLNGYKLYINGRLVAQASPIPGHSGTLSAFGTVNIGDFSFKGGIDEVELFYRALSADEIKSIYLAGAAGKCKTRLKVPGFISLCGTSPTSLIMTATLWNDSPIQKTYQLSFGPASGLAGCTGPALTPAAFAIQAPSSNPITLPANTPSNMPVTVKVKITAPPGLACGKVSCYSMCATDVATGETVCSEGKLSRNCNWWWDGPPDPDPTGSALQFVEFSIENIGDGDGTLPYQVTVVGSDPMAPPPPVSLNGLLPGGPVTGTLMAPLGQSGQFVVSVEFLESLPFEVFELVLETDSDNDGVLELFGTQTLWYVADGSASPCPADLDGSELVDGGDLGLLLGAWGTPGPIGDLDGSGEVDGGDLGLLLGAWGTCP